MVFVKIKRADTGMSQLTDKTLRSYANIIRQIVRRDVVAIITDKSKIDAQKINEAKISKSLFKKYRGALMSVGLLDRADSAMSPKEISVLSCVVGKYTAVSEISSESGISQTSVYRIASKLLGQKLLSTQFRIKDSGKKELLYKAKSSALRYLPKEGETTSPS